MEKDKIFQKVKEVTKLLEGLNYYECERVLNGVINNMEYRKNKTLKETVFTYEEILIC